MNDLNIAIVSADKSRLDEIGLAAPEARPDPVWWHQEPSGEAVCLGLHLFDPIRFAHVL